MGDPRTPWRISAWQFLMKMSVILSSRKRMTTVKILNRATSMGKLSWAHLKADTPKAAISPSGRVQQIGYGNSPHTLLAFRTVPVSFFSPSRPAIPSPPLLAEDPLTICSQCDHFSFKWPQGSCSAKLMPASSFKFICNSHVFNTPCTSRNSWTLSMNEGHLAVQRLPTHFLTHCLSSLICSTERQS